MSDVVTPIPSGQPVATSPLTPGSSVGGYQLHKEQVSKRFSPVILAILVLGGVGFGIWFYISQRSQSTAVPDLSQPRESPFAKMGQGAETEPTSGSPQEKSPAAGLFESVSITAGPYVMKLPKSWSAQISSKSKKIYLARFYPNPQESQTYLEIQVGEASDFSANDLIRIDGEETKGTKTLAYTFREGKENFLSSKRLLYQSQFEKGGTRMLLTLYAPETTFVSLKKIFVAISDLVKLEVSPTSFSPWLIGSVYAAEATAAAQSTPSAARQIAGFDRDLFKPVEIMEGPYPERLAAGDIPYKNGFARLYSFEALKGQRIEVLAEESPTVGSFIESEIYDQEGALALKGQTRLSLPPNFTRNYTGKYYLIVNSFGQKLGPFLLKVFDLDQVQDLFFARYADGSEILLNGGVLAQKALPGVALISFSNPIEMVGDNSVRYFRKSDNGCIDCKYLSSWFGDKTLPIRAFVKDAGSSSEAVEVPVKLTKIFLNQILVQPLDAGAFAQGKSITISMDFGKAPDGTGSGVQYHFLTN